MPCVSTCQLSGHSLGDRLPTWTSVAIVLIGTPRCSEKMHRHPQSDVAATVDADGLTRDIAGLVGNQPRTGAGDIFGLALTPDWSGVGPGFPRLMPVREELLRHDRVHHKTGRYVVVGDTQRPQFHLQGLGQGND